MILDGEYLMEKNLLLQFTAIEGLFCIRKFEVENFETQEDIEMRMSKVLKQYGINNRRAQEILVEAYTQYINILENLSNDLDEVHNIFAKRNRVQNAVMKLENLAFNFKWDFRFLFITSTSKNENAALAVMEKFLDEFSFAKNYLQRK